jgi:hypothetical protein
MKKQILVTHFETKVVEQVEVEGSSSSNVRRREKMTLVHYENMQRFTTNSPRTFHYPLSIKRIQYWFVNPNMKFGARYLMTISSI